MPRPTTPQFEQDYLAFIDSYAPGDDATLARLEFVERLANLIDLAAPEAVVAPTHLDLTGGSEFVQPDLQTMRRRNAGWIARLKVGEEMGGFVPWPPAN